MRIRDRRQTDGLVVGRRLDGRPFAIPYPEQLPHQLIGGETGSGKSGLLAAQGAALAPLEDVAMLGVDLKLTELARWHPRLTALATTPKDASLLFALGVAEMHRRNALMQSLGLRKWDTDLGPWIFIIVDELARLAGIAVEQLLAQALADTVDPKLVRQAKDALGVRLAMIDQLAALGRAPGIRLITATQYPTADVIDSSIRSQLTLRFMLRVISREQVAVILGAGNEANITPSSIPVRERGGFWCVGLPEDPRPVRGRALLIDDDTLDARFASFAHLRVPQDQVFKADPEQHQITTLRVVQ
ncbi:MAG: FtsK/SpoIIIE domain-containing protein [Actinomycetota bacterium]